MFHGDLVMLNLYIITVEFFYSVLSNNLLCNCGNIADTVISYLVNDLKM